MRLLDVMLASMTLVLLLSLLFAAVVAAQVPPPHVQLAPRSHIIAALRGCGACEAAGRAACVGDARSSILAAPCGGSGGPGAAAARPACAHEAAGRAACVGGARSSIGL